MAVRTNSVNCYGLEAGRPASSAEAREPLSRIKDSQTCPPPEESLGLQSGRHHDLRQNCGSRGTGRYKIHRRAWRLPKMGSIRRIFTFETPARLPNALARSMERSILFENISSGAIPHDCAFPWARGPSLAIKNQSWTLETRNLATIVDISDLECRAYPWQIWTKDTKRMR